MNAINILCVDDDLNVLEGYRRTFGRRYNVYLAQGPLQGVDKLQLGPFYSAIISDKNMPLMDGIDFLDFAKHVFPGSVRLMLTGLADDPATLEALKEGKIQRLLAKPCPVKELEKAVEEAVGQAWERLEEPVAA
jgi:response regulator RpfG family c-di-GMP phosphodiesterase